MAKVDKLIVTNAGALRAKYGSAGLTRIRAAVAALIKADAARGLTAKLVALDDRAAMKTLRAKPVADAGDPQQNKIAIDGIYAARTPDYLMILGAIDVVPHQDLTNPLYSPDPEADDDRYAWGDLPYACEAPYSHDPGDFRGPSRVVGRLPDLTGATDPAYLIGLLQTAAKYQTRPRSAYDDYFGLSALVWKRSTDLSVRNLFGASTALRTSPKAGPSWTKAQLAPRAHFINCHGATDDPFFYGQSGRNYPPAHSAKLVARHVSDGTVLAAECCFGGQLYDPQGGQLGICSTYLASGAYGVFGSSTIAYGPSEGNGSADLICQFFLEQVLSGASLGRAALEARQRFVERVTLLDPADMKTLAQFSLLGDPAIHAVFPAQGALTRTKTYRAAVGKSAALPIGRDLRRERLMRRGIALPGVVAAVRKKSAPAPKPVHAMLARAARESAMSGVRFVSFAARPLRDGLPKGAKRMVAGPTDVYVATGHAPKPPDSPIRLPVVLTATIKDGEVVRFRRLHGK